MKDSQRKKLGANGWLIKGAIEAKKKPEWAIDHENWCPIHKKFIARNQLECFDCKNARKNFSSSNPSTRYHTKTTRYHTKNKQ